MMVTIESIEYWSAWPYPDTTFDLWIQASDNFVTNEGQFVARGLYRKFQGTVVNGRAIVPEIQLPVSAYGAGLDGNNSTWTATLHRRGTRTLIDTLCADFYTALTDEPSTTWALLRLRTGAQHVLEDNYVYTRPETESLVDQKIALVLNDAVMTPGTYGTTTKVPRTTYDARGRAIAVEEVDILGGGGGGALPGYTHALLPTPNAAAPGSLARVTDEGNRIVIDTGAVWALVGEGIVNVQWLGASGAAGPAIDSTYTRTNGAVAAGATTVNVLSGSSFDNGEQLLITSAGPGGGPYRGLIVSGGGTTTLTVYPAIQTAVSSGALVLHTGGGAWTKTTAGTAAAGTSLTVEDSSTFKVGQGVAVVGAGAVSGGGNAYFIGTVQAVPDATHITLTSGITTAITANAIVMHDDTAAFNAAFALVSTLKSFKIYVPAGYYPINGPGLGVNLARIRLPAVPSNSAYAIELTGAPRGIPLFAAFLANQPPLNVGTILQSDGVGGSIIGGDATSVGLTLRELTIRTYDNPKIRGMDSRDLAFIRQYHIFYDTGSQPAAMTQPTDTTNTAFHTGLSGNAAEQIVYDVAVVGGYYYGAIFTEHANVSEFGSLGNYYGFAMDSAVHPIYFDKVAVHECVRGFTPLSQLSFHMSSYVVERRGPTLTIAPWTETEYDIYDPNNYGRGEVPYTVQEGGTNFLRALLKSGGQHIQSFLLSTGRLQNLGVSFTDGLSDNITDGKLWVAGSGNISSVGTLGTIQETGGSLRVTPAASVGGLNYSGYVTRDTFDGFGKTIAVRISGVTTNGADTILAASHDASNRHMILIASGAITFIQVYNGAGVSKGSVAYSPVNHLWVRLRYYGDYLIAAETSPNNSAWTTLGLDSDIAYFPVQMRYGLLAGSSSSIAVPGTAIFNDFSVQ